MMEREREKLKIYIVGVGGQGTLTAAKLLGETALEAGLPAVVSEVHGMAQRGGVVETSVLLGGYRGPIIGKGGADVILAFEPLEALRALPKASSETWLIVNTYRIKPITVALKLGEYPDLEEALAVAEAKVAQLLRLNATELAKQAGAALATNMVMLGALAATGLLPFPSEVLLTKIIEFAPRLREVNEKAYLLGYEEVERLRREARVGER